MSDREGNASPYSVGSIPTAEIDGCRQSASDRKQMAVVCGDFTIDWQAAAPGWGAIFVGVILPISGAFLAFALICWLISGSLLTSLVFVLAGVVGALCFATHLIAEILPPSDEKASR